MAFARVLAALYAFVAILAPTPAWATSIDPAEDPAQMQRPPSTSMQTPVIIDASSEHR